MKKGGCADENKGGVCDKTACGYILYYTDIWDLLQKDLSWEELLSAYMEYVKSIEMTENTKTVKPASIGEEASTVTAASISSDLSTYVLMLFQFGMIQASAKEMQAFPFAPFQAKENAYYCRYIIKAERNGFMCFLNLF